MNLKANLELQKLKVALRNEEEFVRHLKNGLSEAKNEAILYKEKVQVFFLLIFVILFTNLHLFIV